MRSSRRLVIPGWNSSRQDLQCIVQINSSKKGNRSGTNSDLILKGIYTGVFSDQARALRDVAGKHRKCTKRNLQLQNKVNKIFQILWQQI